MSHPNAEMVRYVRAYLLRSSDKIDSRTVEAFVASELLSAVIATFNDSVLRRFQRFASPTEAVSPQPTAPTVSRYDFENFSALPRPPAPKPPPKANEAMTKPDMPAVTTDPQSNAAPAAVVAPAQTAPAAPQAEATVVPAGSAQAAAAPVVPMPQSPPPDAAFRMANARAGEAYVHKLVPQSGAIDDLMLLEIKFPLQLDFRADLLAGVIAGTPATAGDFQIDVLYCFKSEGPTRKRRASIPLLVNPDPKSLWKDLPSDRSDLFWKEDAICATVAGPEFRMIAASKRGRSHAHVGGFRDDDYFIHHCQQTGWYTTIVADGAGSAKYSRRGAKLVCDEAGAHLVDALQGKVGTTIDAAATAYHKVRSAGSPPAALDAAWQELRNALYMAVGHAAFHSVKAITDTVAARTDLQATYKDFSTTALISITRRFPFGTLCAAYWVGDGAVGIYSKDHGVKLLGAADSGEFSGQTRFLDASEVTAEALLRRTRFELVDDLTALILMTDGVSDPKFDTEANLERPAAWDALWSDLDQSINLHQRAEGTEQRLLSWLDFWSQGNHDDRTIAIVYQEQ